MMHMESMMKMETNKYVFQTTSSAVNQLDITNGAQQAMHLVYQIQEQILIRCSNCWCS